MMGLSGYTWAWIALGTVIVVMLAWMLLREPDFPTVDSARWKFAVETTELVEKWSLEDIEAREMVTDPLKAVPNLPFGHLNPVWQRFLSELPPDCELWSFVSEREKPCDEREYRRGYVAVVDGTTGPYILTEARMVESTLLHQHFVQ